MGFIDWLSTTLKSLGGFWGKKVKSAATSFGLERAKEWGEYEAEKRAREADRKIGKFFGIPDTQNPVDRALERGVDAIHDTIGSVAGKVGYNIAKSKFS